MIYKLDGIDIRDYGAKLRRTDQCFALHGFLDLPARIGNTEHNWGTSIEPFVDKEDIELDGRKLLLHVAIETSQLQGFLDCITCDKLTIENDGVVANFDVVNRDEVIVNNVGKYKIVDIPFWQYRVELFELTSIGSASSDSGFAIDNYDLGRDFNVHLSRGNNIDNIAKRIEVQTTEFYKNRHFRDTRDVELVCFMRTGLFTDVYKNITQLQALMYSPGMHTLKVGQMVLDVYFKSGMEVKAIYENLLQFTLKATVV